jgi:hypothetical protein
MITGWLCPFIVAQNYTHQPKQTMPSRLSAIAVRYRKARNLYENQKVEPTKRETLKNTSHFTHFG